jgi:hypothetical protein
LAFLNAFLLHWLRFYSHNVGFTAGICLLLLFSSVKCNGDGDGPNGDGDGPNGDGDGPNGDGDGPNGDVHLTAPASPKAPPKPREINENSAGRQNAEVTNAIEVAVAAKMTTPGSKELTRYYCRIRRLSHRG